LISEAVSVEECPTIMSLFQLREQLYELWTMVADQ